MVFPFLKNALGGELHEVGSSTCVFGAIRLAHLQLLDQDVSTMSNEAREKVAAGEEHGCSAALRCRSLAIPLQQRLISGTWGDNASPAMK
eukprot:1499228-Amphidinium_carterae.1